MYNLVNIYIIYIYIHIYNIYTYIYILHKSSAFLCMKDHNSVHLYEFEGWQERLGKARKTSQHPNYQRTAQAWKWVTAPKSRRTGKGAWWWWFAHENDIFILQHHKFFLQKSRWHGMDMQHGGKIEKCAQNVPPICWVEGNTQFGHRWDKNTQVYLKESCYAYLYWFQLCTMCG